MRLESRPDSSQSSPRRSLLASCWRAALLATLLPASTQAGTGTFREGPDSMVLDFCVSIQFNASPAELDAIRDVFTAASAVLADATDDQLRFGDIALFENGLGASEAEVHIFSGSGTATATAGEYGVRGSFIEMFYDTNFDPAQHSTAGQAEEDPYSLAHEFCHHLWSLIDEYNGPSCAQEAGGLCNFAVCCDGCGNGKECEPLPGSTAATFCLLDNFKDRGGNLNNPAQDDFTLNELCVATNHDPDQDTGQQCINGASCWDTVAQHPTRPLSPPGGLPAANEGLSVPVPGFPTLVPTSRFVLCLDRSGSMATPDAGAGETRMARAKQAGNIFAELTEVGDWLGVTSFNCNATDDYGLVEVDGQAEQNGAITALDGVDAGGNTAIGRGLAASRDLILTEAQACNQPIVLLTDGRGNCGAGELSVVDSLIENRISATTVAIGADPEQDNLIEIAQRTGGKFYWVETAEDLPGLSSLIYAEVSGKELISLQQGSASGSQSISGGHLLDIGTKQVTFVLTWTNPAAGYNLAALSPGGAIFDESTAAGDPSIEYSAGKGYAILRIGNIGDLPGDWRTLAVPDGGAIVTPYQLVTIADVHTTDLTVSTDRPTYSAGDAIFVRATPRHRGSPIGPVAITATVVRPNGVTETLTLLDDGNGPNGDSVAGDGTYTARLDNAVNPGAYSFVVSASSMNANTLPGEALFADPLNPEVFLSVPEFERVDVVTAVVGSSPCGYTNYGEELPPAHALDLFGLGGTWIGSTAQIETIGPGSGAAVTGVSFEPAYLPALGGVLLIEPAGLIQTKVYPNYAGSALWSLPLPLDMNLIGLPLYFQTLAQSSAQPFGWAFSDGLRLVICAGPNG